MTERTRQRAEQLLGPDHDPSPYTQTGERVRQLAAMGVRLVIGELRTDVTKTRQDGTPGRLRVDYGDPRNPEAAVKWLWRYLDGAKTAGELYGRALVVIAAETYASRLVVPASQRLPATRWSSRNDTAAKALKRLAGPHLPGPLKQLERAVDHAHATYEQATTRPTPGSGDPTPQPEDEANAAAASATGTASTECDSSNASASDDAAADCVDDLVACPTSRTLRPPSAGPQVRSVLSIVRGDGSCRASARRGCG